MAALPADLKIENFKLKIPVGVSFSGRTRVSKTRDEGSIPSTPADNQSLTRVRL